MDEQNYNNLLPVMCGNCYGRIIGSPSNCIVLNGEPSMFFVATPHGTVLVSGRASVRLLKDDEFDTLLDLEECARKSGKTLYGGEAAFEKANLMYTGGTE